MSTLQPPKDLEMEIWAKAFIINPTPYSFPYYTYRPATYNFIVTANDVQRRNASEEAKKGASNKEKTWQLKALTLSYIDILL